MKKLLLQLMPLLMLWINFAFAISTNTSGSWGNEKFSMHSDNVDKFKTLQNEYFCKESFKETFKYCDSNDISNWEIGLRAEDWIVTINGKNICVVNWSEVTDIAQCNTTFTSLQSWKWYDCTVISGVEKCIDANTQTSYGINLSSSEWNKVNDETSTGKSNGISNNHCTLNGQIVPCEQLQKQAFSIFKYIAWFGFVILILGIIWTIFWILMLIDVIRYQEKDKSLRILILVFLNVIGAVVYFFTAKKHRDNKSK